MVVVPCHYGTVLLQVVDAEGLQLWRAAANILNKQLRMAVVGWSTSFETGWRARNCSYEITCYQTLHRASNLDGMFGMTKN
jgi:hypothetical protein